MESRIVNAFRDSLKPPLDEIADLSSVRSGELPLLSVNWLEAYSSREDSIDGGEFALLKDSGFLYFLPSFMLCCMGRPPNPDILDSVARHLIVPKRLLRVLNTFSDDQIGVVCSFILYLTTPEAWPGDLP